MNQAERAVCLRFVRQERGTWGPFVMKNFDLPGQGCVLEAFEYNAVAEYLRAMRTFNGFIYVCLIGVESVDQESALLGDLDHEITLPTIGYRTNFGDIKVR